MRNRRVLSHKSSKANISAKQRAKERPLQLKGSDGSYQENVGRSWSGSGGKGGYC